MTRVLAEGAVRLAVPSKGRLREDCLQLLSRAGYPTGMLHGAGSIATVEADAGAIALIEMRPRDAAAALAAGQLDAAFLATDIVVEHELDDHPTLALGFSRSDLVVASREEDGRSGLGDLEGAVVATHLPELTRRLFAAKGLDVTVLSMGGSLEGVCAAGIADAIVDLRETGTSLAQNRLRVLEVLRRCEALLVSSSPTRRAPGHGAGQAPGAPASGALDDLVLRVEAVLAARRHRYLMLHVPRERLDGLRSLFPGLAAPTVLPLAGRDDLVAVHLVVADADLWSRLGDQRALGATGIVALQPDALLP